MEFLGTGWTDWRGIGFGLKGHQGMVGVEKTWKDKLQS